jgi:hypothetical protein
MKAEQSGERLIDLASAWAAGQEEWILANGGALDERYRDDAARAGVRDCSRVRVLIVEKIALPDDAELAEAARRHQIITDASRGVAIGYGIIIRADCWTDRELMVHQLVHVAQRERCRNTLEYIGQYLQDRRSCARFTIGRFEEEARQTARQICQSDGATIPAGAA